MIEFNIKEEEQPSPKLRETTYIDLTLEDDEVMEAKGRELITNGLELESEHSSSSESPSEDGSMDIKKEERSSFELREPTYIDLTLEDDETLEVEGKELITNGLELEPEQSSLSELPSDDESIGSNSNNDGMKRNHKALMSSDGGRIIGARKSRQNAGGSLD
jgi:hypothetical protein